MEIEFYFFILYDSLFCSPQLEKIPPWPKSADFFDFFLGKKKLSQEGCVLRIFSRRVVSVGLEASAKYWSNFLYSFTLHSLISDSSTPVMAWKWEDQTGVILQAHLADTMALRARTEYEKDVNSIDCNEMSEKNSEYFLTEEAILPISASRVKSERAKLLSAELFDSLRSSWKIIPMSRSTPTN